MRGDLCVRGHSQHDRVDTSSIRVKVSPDTVSRLFGSEPGVIDLGSPERRYKRRYRVLRIPAAVLNRFLHKNEWHKLNWLAPQTNGC